MNFQVKGNAQFVQKVTFMQIGNQKLLLLKVRFTKVIKQQLLFYVTVLFNYFHETIFWGYTKIKIALFLEVYNFTKTILQDDFLRKKKATFQVSSSITESYLEPNRKSMKDFLVKTIKPKSPIIDTSRVLNTPLHLFQHFHG